LITATVRAASETAVISAPDFQEAERINELAPLRFVDHGRARDWRTLRPRAPSNHRAAARVEPRSAGVICGMSGHRTARGGHRPPRSNGGLQILRRRVTFVCAWSTSK